MTANDADGNQVLIPVPASLGATYLPIDSHGDIEIVNNTITAGDGTVINVPDGVVASTINPDFVLSSDYLPESAFSIEDAKRANSSSRLALNGNLNFNVMDNVRMRVGARVVTAERESASTWAVFAPEDRTLNTSRGPSVLYLLDSLPLELYVLSASG